MAAVRLPKAYLPDEYLYIEKSSELQIAIPNTINAHVVQSQGHIVLHITGEESGNYCGLPSSCKCPVQHTLQITPQQSVSNIANMGLERVYSYATPEININVITNTVSTSATCRSNYTEVLNEFTSLTWSNSNVDNRPGGSYIHPEHISGYISDAEFFSLNGYTYTILSRFYEPVSDTHILDCYVFRTTKEKDRAELIQTIKSKGSWTLHLFHTAQGVILIIGNIFYSNRTNAETEIYRFDEVQQQFMFLRGVPDSGCTSAAGVVLGLDSLIILAQRSAPLQVLKYNSHYDNYYFYQSVQLDSPILEVSTFYIGGFGISDVYLCVVSENGGFYVYSFQYIQGWKLESHGEIDDLQALVPFELNKQRYLFAPSTKMSSLLTIFKQGSN